MFLLTNPNNHSDKKRIFPAKKNMLKLKPNIDKTILSHKKKKLLTMKLLKCKTKQGNEVEACQVVLEKIFQCSDYLKVFKNYEFFQEHCQRHTLNNHEKQLQYQFVELYSGKRSENISNDSAVCLKDGDVNVEEDSEITIELPEEIIITHVGEIIRKIVTLVVQSQEKSI